MKHTIKTEIHEAPQLNTDKRTINRESHSALSNVMTNRSGQRMKSQRETFE